MGDDAELWMESGGDPTTLIWDDYDDYDDYTDLAVKNAVVYIDAENINITEFTTIQRKIKKFCKNQGLSIVRSHAYAVENSGQYKYWAKSTPDGVKLIPISGNPANDKADKQIEKEALDRKGKNEYHLIVTHDKGLKARISSQTANKTRFFPEA